ncbi:MAG TPA: hypothetical protein VJW93_07820 [Candidatus Acidoferrales bacterium]|nr:hypothetical protein [Candidatus Acidoferrales bacterium]
MTKMLASIAVGLILLTGNTAPNKPAAPPEPLAYRSFAAQDSDTETVLSTFRPRAGKEDELLKTMGKNWSTLSKLGLVLQQPHIVLRGKDDAGKTIFVELFTWRDHEAADHVPAEVQTIWNQLQSEVEDRSGHRGIEFPEFEIVSATP